MQTKKRVDTVVIPAAGLGTRSLPATKVLPKELLPVLDVPAIHLIVEEASEAGIERVVLVLSRGKHLLMDYFDRHPELEASLKNKGREDLYERVTAPVSLAHVLTVRQHMPLGLGHSVLSARAAVGEGPFAVILPDDLMVAEIPAIQQLLNVRLQAGEPDAVVVGLIEVPEGTEHLYGIVEVKETETRPMEPLNVRRLTEKPRPGTAPSRLAIVGRYLLPQKIFDTLASVPKGAGGEIQLTDGIQALADRGHPVLGCLLSGVRFDLGDHVGYVRATVWAALKRESLAPRIRQALAELLDETQEP